MNGTMKNALRFAAAAAVLAAASAALFFLLRPGRESVSLQTERDCFGGIKITARVGDMSRPAELFDVYSGSAEAVCVSRGDEFILEISNLSDEAAEVVLYADPVAMGCDAPGGEDGPGGKGRLCVALGPGESFTSGCVAAGDVCLNGGASVSRGGMSVACAGDGDILAAMCSESYDAIFLMRSVNVRGDLSFGGPAALSLEGHALDIAGELLLDTRESGSFTVGTGDGGSLSAEGFYACAENCSVSVPEGCFDFEDRPGYYLSVASLNGRAVERVRPVRTQEEFDRLLDGDRLPKILSGDTVSVEFDACLPDGCEITVPVTLSVRGRVTGDGPLLIRTRESGSVTVEEGAGGRFPAELLSVDAPFCSMTFLADGAPGTREAAELFNVAEYNGYDLSPYGLGGEGSAVLTDVRAVNGDGISEASDVSFSIRGNLVLAEVPYLASDSTLDAARLRAESEGGRVSFSGSAGDSLLSGDMLCTVTDSLGKTRVYVFRARRSLCDIPAVDIRTDDGDGVASLEEYESAVISITCPDGSGYPGLEATDVNIRGRGHSTWQWPKKPYKLKFDEKTPVLGMTAAKQWTLLANYSDKSLIRNSVAMEMAGQLCNLPFAPSQIPVDVFLNGEYQGVYTLGEQIEIKEGRVEVPSRPGEADTAYLLEIGGAEEGDENGKDYFHAGELRFVKVKDPDGDELTDEQFSYIRDYMQKANDAVVSLDGYEDYIDVDSLIDWFILHEWTYNLDSSFRRSCYMVKEPGGKLVMGPPWDFDLAFGNFSRDGGRYDVWACMGSSGAYVSVNWMNHLLTDENFLSRLSKRWAEVRGPMEEHIMSYIDGLAADLQKSQELNFTVWDVWDVKAGYQPSFMVDINTYEKQIEYLKDFIHDRGEWMDSQLM